MDASQTRGPRAPARRWFRLALAAALVAFASASATTPAQAAVTPSPQPALVPGGSDQPHAGLRVSSGGTGADAWYVFEPTTPQPVSAPLAIIMHGYGEFAGYDTMLAFIRHTVLAGTSSSTRAGRPAIATPCPGPFDIEPCMTSAVNGIRGALAYLKAHRDHVQPQLGRTSYFGFSFGGIITANLASRHRTLGLPKPRAIFLDDPHDGALTGFGEPALDDALTGIPSSTLVRSATRARRACSRSRTKADSKAAATRSSRS